MHMPHVSDKLAARRGHRSFTHDAAARTTATYGEPGLEQGAPLISRRMRSTYASGGIAEAIERVAGRAAPAASADRLAACARGHRRQVMHSWVGSRHAPL
jgi:hypothetical protein